MKDTKKPLRIALFNALNGNITYSGNPIPVVDEMIRNSAPSDFFIALSNQSETAVERNSSTWVTQSSIEFDIVQKTPAGASKDPIDAVYESVLQIVFPTIGTTGLTVPSGFQFLEGYRESAGTSFAMTETQNILMTRVKLTFIIVET